jgi:hypothetical protein
VENPPWTRRKVPRKNLVQPAGASAGYATPPGSTRLVAFCFPLSRSSCEPTPCTPSPQPPSARSPPFPSRAEGEPRKDHRLPTARGSVFVATKMAHRSLSRNSAFLLGNSEPPLRSWELISTMGLERAAPVGFAGRVARREFSANSPPSGTATDSAAFQWAGNLWV